MRVRIICAVVAFLAGGLTTAQPAAPDSDAGVAPFSAHYIAEWKGISVGTSDLELARDVQPGQ